MANCHILPSQRVWVRATRDFNVAVFFQLYKKPFSTLKLQDQFYCCFTRNIHFGTDALKHVLAFFITIVRENLANRGESSLISLNSCQIRAAFGIFMSPPFRVGRHIVFPRASVCPAVCLSVRPSVCLSVCLSVCHKSCPLYNLKTA